MIRSAFPIVTGSSIVIAGLLFACSRSVTDPAKYQNSVAVTVPARAGAVEGMTQNSDAFIWQLFTQFAAPVSSSRPSPVVFETWASDGDTFSNTPHWPGPDEPKRLHRSVLSRQLYYTGNSDSVEYALVSLHVSSRQNPNWVWGTFEHQMNPGRCDDLGCFDSFGATIPAVRPNKAAVNTQYGPCPKSDPLKAMMASAKLSPVWENYCLKSTEVDYVAADGTPYALGNSVIERIVGNGTVAASSCIACHVYASFGSNGQPSSGATAMLPYNPTGNPIPEVLAGSLQFDFMWGVLQAPAAPSSIPK